MRRAVLVVGALLALGLHPLPAAAEDCAAPTVGRYPGIPWAQHRLAPERAWTLTRGEHVLIAVVDTGVSATAPALAGAVRTVPELAPGRPAGEDCQGHGTFVAGLAAGRPRPGGGFVGVAPAAGVLAVRVTDSPESTRPAYLARGIRAAVAAGASVIAVPLGVPVATAELRAAVADARRRGAVVVAAVAAGGSTAPARYPAALPGVVAVAGVGADGAPAGGSEPLDPPTVAAPGDQLVGPAARGGGESPSSDPAMAVGFVAGVVALVRSYRPDLSASEVVRRLAGTADHPTGTLPDPAVGWGVVDPAAAVSAVLPEEDGGTAPLVRPAPVLVPRPAPPDRRAARSALVGAGLVAVLAVLVVTAVAVVARGRRRRWRPAG